MLFVKVIIIFICIKIYVFRSGLSNGNLYRQKKFLPPAVALSASVPLKIGRRTPQSTVLCLRAPQWAVSCYNLLRPAFLRCAVFIFIYPCF
ncbi:MAG: hypothetical protein BHW56_07450 [Acetobacter sp. 46_36]|nr:MAG: hypothetical protein BHW56_07450 [Acetobacter sp. 46_36]